MERLTYWNEEYGCWSYRCPSGDAAKRLAAYEDTGLEPEEIKLLNEEVECRFLIWIEKHYGISGGELMELVKARDEHKAYKLDGFYCDICKKKHMRVVEIDGAYFTSAEAEAAIGGGGDG